MNHYKIINGEIEKTVFSASEKMSESINVPNQETVTENTKYFTKVCNSIDYKVNNDGSIIIKSKK